MDIVNDRIAIMAARLALAFSFAVNIGCSDDTGGTEETNPPPPPVEAGPLYAITATNFSADFSMSTSYIALVDSLDKGTTIDYTKALEVQGLAFIAGQSRKNQFFVLNSGDLTIDKYQVDEDGNFAQLGSLGFSQYGITTFTYKTVEFIDDKTAYLLNNESSEVVVFNPSDMTISGTIDLGGLAYDTWLPVFGTQTLKRRGDQLFVFGNYASFATDSSGPESRVAIIDTKTQEVKFIQDTRCGSASFVTESSSGDLYAATETFSASAHRQGHGPAPCMLRIPAGQDAFDPDFYVELGDLTDGSATGGLMVGANDEVYLRAFDEQVVPVTPELTAVALISVEAWRWWEVKLGSTTAGTKLESPGLSAGAITTFKVEDDFYASKQTANYSDTTFIRTTGENGPEEGISMKGWGLGALRLR